MASGEVEIQVELATKAVSAGAKATSNALTGLKKTIQSLKTEIVGAFALSEMAGYFREAVQSSGKLDKQLLVLRLSLGKLKAAIGSALAPLGEVFLPVVSRAVLAASRFAKAAGQVIGALFGSGEASRNLEEDSKNAAKAQVALAGASGKLKRSLAGFDEITRLDAPSGGGSGSSAVTAEVSTGEIKDTLTPELQRIVDKILSLVAPLRQIDFTPAVQAFGRLREALAPIGRSLFAGLEWAWHNLLVPLAQWSIEDFLPVFLDTVSSALGVLNSVVTALQPMAVWLWEEFLKPLAQWTGGVILEALQSLRDKLGHVSSWILNNREVVQNFAAVVGVLTGAWVLASGALSGWNGLGNTASTVIGILSGKMGGLSNPIGVVIGAISLLSGAVTLLSGLWNTVQNSAASAWQGIVSVWGNVTSWFRLNVLAPLESGFRSTVNGIIGFLNGMILGVVRGINGVVNALNSLHFTIPSWIPGLGGRSLGFSLRTVSAPQIPYLAQGAVLPANKPFLAMVGDQKHGTNIEAPLQTIQDAVAMVMGDQTSAILSGFQTSVEVQREILQAVLGIHIGDEVIGQAVCRYQRKLAVVRGG